MKPSDFLMTVEEFEKLPKVEGPSLEQTDQEDADLNQPRLNGGIHMEGCFAVFGGHCTCYDLIINKP